ncbi:MAG TPA: hypothetical protein VMR31_10540 [Myxococcota bacterium]|nr:hypothetical protein [Myxococcota bacterium]
MSRCLCALVLALALFGAATACVRETDVDARAASIEHKLLASCSCHPKKIAGLPLETEIRAAIREGIAEGKDDDAVLWGVLQTHGTALLAAGIQDLETRAAAFSVETGALIVVGLGVLMLQLRRRESD